MLYAHGDWAEQKLYMRMNESTLVFWNGYITVQK